MQGDKKDNPSTFDVPHTHLGAFLMPRLHAHYVRTCVRKMVGLGNKNAPAG